MACSSCKQKRAAIAAAPTPDGFQTKEAAGWPLVRYIGNNRADTVWSAPTGRRYYFGANQENEKHWVHPDDLAWFMRWPKAFQHMNLPDPEPEPAVTAEAVPAPLPPPPPPPATIPAGDLDKTLKRSRGRGRAPAASR